MTNYYQ